MLGALLVARLLLSLLTHDALIVAVRRFRSRLGLRLRHALLAAMFAALILHTFQIVFSGHRDQTLSCRRIGFLRTNAVHDPGVPAVSGSIGFRSRKSQWPSGTPIGVVGFDSRINHPRRILMRSKLALSALVIASMLGATAIASAQTQQPAPGASSEGNVTPGATSTKKSSKMKSGTTTGSSMKSGKKGAAAPGMDNGAGSDSK
jgi:hypothetical protein